jgi:hypothetical protein
VAVRGPYFVAAAVWDDLMLDQADF